MKKSAKQRVKRRKFLKGTAIAGAAVGSGAITTEALAEATTEKPEKPETLGYRETDHIRTYYRVARF